MLMPRCNTSHICRFQSLLALLSLLEYHIIEELDMAKGPDDVACTRYQALVDQNTTGNPYYSGVFPETRRVNEAV
jgi:hypothetical protein